MEAEDLEDPVRCVIRETHEETGGAVMLVPTQLTKLGILQCYAGGMPDFQVHIFYTETHDLPSEIPETADMEFSWYAIDNLPFERMLESDREWFEKAACGEPVNANVYYGERAKGFQGIEYRKP